MVNFLAQLPAILFAISVHEFGHGFVAHLLGDDTAKKSGRLTLDPLKHIDLVGFLVMMVAHFGWAKPVPINPDKFKNKRIGMFLVSIAGPMCNILLAIVSIYLFDFQRKFIHMYALETMIRHLYGFNIMFAVFNLLPIPPLDGSKIVLSILPETLNHYYWKYENVGSIILLLLIMTDKVSLVLEPMYNSINSFMTIFM